MTTTATRARGSKVAYVVIGAFVGLCAIGWAIIIAHTEGTPGISPEIVSWQATDASVRIHFEIAKPKSHVVHCAVIAYDTAHAEIGHVQVDVPAGTSNLDTRQTVPTTSRATAVDVRDCRTG